MRNIMSLLLNNTKIIEKEMILLEAMLRKVLLSDIALATEIASYLVGSGGKRIRPYLTILTGKALGYKKRKLITLACVIELLHTASLIHDDIVDKSDLRRGNLSVNAKWDNAHGVLVGDFVYSKAFQLMASLENNHAIKTLADSTNRISEGEVLQLILRGQANCSEKDYFEIIGRKTAELFKASSLSAAIIAETSKELRQSSSKFAYSLGIAFQIKDDLLDYIGEEKTTGKKIGKDFEEGKLTLPLIKTFSLCSKKEIKFLKDTLKKKDNRKLSKVISIVRNSGALKQVEKEVNKHSKSCLKQLSLFPQTPYRTELENIVNSLKIRKK